MGRNGRPRIEGHCAICGVWRRSLHRDHIVPKFKGGPDTDDNIQLICANCHEDKTAQDLMGRVHTEETKARISATLRGLTPSIETREIAGRTSTTLL